MSGSIRSLLLRVSTCPNMASLMAEGGPPRPRLLVSDAGGLEIFTSPEEGTGGVESLSSAGLSVAVQDKQQSATSGLLHGVDKPLTAFTADGSVMAVFDSGRLSFYDTLLSKELAAVDEGLGRVELMSFSPRGTYLVTWSRVYKGDTGPNLAVYRVTNGATCEVVTKYFERRQPTWPAIRFAEDESLAARLVKNEVHIFAGCHFERNHTSKIRLEGVTVFSMKSTAGGEKNVFALFKPEDKGGAPARVNIYDASGTVTASKTFYKAQEIDFLWSPSADVVLLQTHTDVSADTYYGESNLFLLHTDGSFDCTVTRTKKGPLHAVAWSPKGNEFTVISGTLPANITVYNPKTGDPYFELGAAARNTLCYSPHGRFLCVAGFGSLRGDMDFWDMNKRKVMGHADGSCSIVWCWSPCGRWFATGSTYPRMQVDNCYKVFKYNGAGPVCEVPSKRLFDIGWLPALPGTYPDRPQEKKKKTDDLVPMAKPAAKAGGGAYRPPGARGGGLGGGRSLSDMLGEGGSGPGKVKTVSSITFSGTARVIPGMNPAPAKGLSKSARRKKKKSESAEPEIDSKPAAAAATPSEIPFSETSEEALRKRLKATTKKLKAVSALKEKAAGGTELNADQLKKVSAEPKLLADIAELEKLIA